MRRLSILGSTGSIGTSTLDVVEALPDQLSIVALAAGRNRERLRAQCEKFRPVCVSLAEAEDAAWLRAALSYAPEIHVGSEGLMACALHPDADTVVAAVVGAAGLASTEAALRAGRRVCVANKESLVVGGELMHQAARAGGGELLPVDSEHAALHQLLDGRGPEAVREVRITASGGPFRDWPLERIQAATVEEALNHPTWKMGPKITIDSATLMNKGLEIIEARWLFDLEPAKIKTLVHPESIVHGIVEFSDNSLFAYMASPDMKIPIAYALYGEQRAALPFSPLKLDGVLKLTFHPPDLKRFPSIRLAYEALEAGDGALIAFNVSNEVAAEAFIDGRIKFTDIPRIVAETLAEGPGHPVVDNLDTIRDIISWTRNVAITKITGTGRKKL